MLGVHPIVQCSSGRRAQWNRGRSSEHNEKNIVPDKFKLVPYICDSDIAYTVHLVFIDVWHAVPSRACDLCVKVRQSWERNSLLCAVTSMIFDVSNDGCPQPISFFLLRSAFEVNRKECHTYYRQWSADWLCQYQQKSKNSWVRCRLSKKFVSHRITSDSILRLHAEKSRI